MDKGKSPLTFVKITGAWPLNAFIGGFDSQNRPIYVARAIHEGGVHMFPTKADPYTGCSFVLQGRESETEDFEVLTTTARQFADLRWVDANLVRFPKEKRPREILNNVSPNNIPRPIPIGTSEGSPIFCGRCLIDNYISIGRVSSDYQTLTCLTERSAKHFNSNGIIRVLQVERFQVLCLVDTVGQLMELKPRNFIENPAASTASTNLAATAPAAQNGWKEKFLGNKQAVEDKAGPTHSPQPSMDFPSTVSSSSRPESPPPENLRKSPVPMDSPQSFTRTVENPRASPTPEKPAPLPEKPIVSIQATVSVPKKIPLFGKLMKKPVAPAPVDEPPPVAISPAKTPKNRQNESNIDEEIP